MMINLLNIKKLDEHFTVKRPWDLIILILISLLLTIPAFIIAHQNLVNLNLSFHLDRILLFVLLFGSFLFILFKLRRITLLTLFGYLLLLFYGTVTVTTLHKLTTKIVLRTPSGDAFSALRICG